MTFQYFLIKNKYDTCLQELNLKTYELNHVFKYTFLHDEFHYMNCLLSLFFYLKHHFTSTYKVKNFSEIFYIINRYPSSSKENISDVEAGH